MSEIQLFSFEDRQVRTLVIDGEPWFVASDVCSVLGLPNVSEALTRLDRADISTTEVSSEGPLRPGQRRSQTVKIVNESGLYDLILDSRKPQARRLRRWVTAEVLPSIRQTGSYGQPRELSRMEILEMAMESERARLAAEARVAELEPDAESYRVLVSAVGDYSLREAAQILSRDPNITIGQNRLANVLRDLGWVDIRSLRPYQAQVDNGRLVARETMWTDPDGAEHVKYQARVTPKGINALRRHLAGVSELVPYTWEEAQ